MYEQISSNKVRSVLLVLVFMLIITGLGYALARYLHYPYLTPLAVVVAVVTSIGGYYNSDKIVLAMSGAREATKPEFAYLLNTVEGLSLAAGIPMPRVYTIDDTAPNAFATGRDPEHAALAVTTGLLEKMDRAELEGVIGHEMAHIKDYDIRLMALVAVLAGTVVLLSDWTLRGMSWGGGGRRRRSSSDSDSSGSAIFLVIALVAAILAPIIATLIQLAVSRQREYLADAQGAMLTRNPDGLASALEKIAADTEPLEVANKATAHMYIYNPLRDHAGMLNGMFSTHPPIEERVRRLRAM